MASSAQPVALPWLLSDGKEGWAPAEFLKPVSSLGGRTTNGLSDELGVTVGVSCKGAYRGKVSRTACEAALRRDGKHRDFIVRESETSAGEHSITVKIHSQIHHFRVEKRAGRLVVGDHSADNLEGIVKLFGKEAIHVSPVGDRTTLGNPYTKSI